MVDVQLMRKFDRAVTLEEIKQHAKLRDMQLVKRGRISVQVVKASEWDYVLQIVDSNKNVCSE